MSSELKYKILWLLIFSVAMGFLEAAVVIYLRELYYPGGFTFPLTAMDAHTGIIELLREAATVVMLAGIGILAGRTRNQRFAFFLLTFAIWDLFYYVFLKTFLDWPVSLLTWDILFLIPVPWFGPVLAPCIISLTMMVLAAVLVYKDLQSPDCRLSLREWLFLVAGSVVVIASWTIDFLIYSFDHSKDVISAMYSYVPQEYNWYLFVFGEVILLIAIFHFWRRVTQ